MDFKLSSEQLMIQNTARSFAQKELAPVAQKLDREKDFSILVANVRKLAELGFMVVREWCADTARRVPRTPGEAGSGGFTAGE